MTFKARNGEADKQQSPGRRYIKDELDAADDGGLAASAGSPRRHIQLGNTPSIDPVAALRSAQPAPTPHKSTNTPAQEALARHARDADYQIGKLLARGAEAVLYRTVKSSNTFCVKAIRNWLAKAVGDTATGDHEGKLNTPYRSKVRHLQNEFQVGLGLQEAGDIPVVRIYALRKARRLGMQIGHDLLMEYIDGIDLSSKQEVRAFTLAQKIDLFYQTAKALQYMHRKSFVHLDMKPSNIMVANGRVKLIDFGVSVSLGHKPRAVTGTAGFMSPEQIARDYLDQGTDIFALGVTFAVIFGNPALRQDPADLRSKAFRANAAYLLGNDEAPILPAVPELREVPVIENLIRRCTIPCRAKRLRDAASLAQQILHAADAAGIPIER